MNTALDTDRSVSDPQHHREIRQGGEADPANGIYHSQARSVARSGSGEAAEGRLGPMRCSTWLLAMWLGVSATACIEGQRQQPTDTPDTADTTDTDTTDTDTINTADTADTDTPDTDTVDTDSPDTPDPDTVPDTTTDTLAECSEDGDCPNAECVVYTCIDKRCEPTDLDDTPCNDGNVCTEGDSCKRGSCHAGAEIDCNTLDEQCLDNPIKTCDSAMGCGTPKPLGTVCNNGQGATSNTCVDGWRIPADSCDGTGMCLDRNDQIPIGFNPLTGDWIIVLATAPTQRSGTTVRLSATFDNDGDFSLARMSRSSNVVIPDLSVGASGTYCVSLEGQVTLTIGTVQLVGWIREGDDLIILRDTNPAGTERFHGIALRANGNSNDVTGTYRLVSTAAYSVLNPAPVMTWQGHLGFFNGCLNDAGNISTGGNLGVTHSYQIAATPSCFFAHDGGHRIAMTLVPEGGTGAQHVPVQWTGAVGARGNVIVLTRDDNNNLRYGIIVLVRDRVADNTQLSGPYVFVSLGGGIASSTQVPSTITPYLETGTIEYLEADTVGGSMASGTVGPGWWHIPALGSRYAHRAAFNGVIREHGGWVARNDSFLMAWRVAPPVNATVPQPLPLTPTEGSLFLALQPADYRSTLNGTE